MSIVAEILVRFKKSGSCLKKPPFSAAGMLVSCLFSRSVVTCQYIAVVSFAGNGRFSMQDD